MKQHDIYDNSLLLVKYIMTFIVIINHCMTHYDAGSWKIGLAAVPVFFFISGFTLYLSLEKKGHSKLYIKRRVLRIFPELWFAVILGSIVIVLQHPDVLKEWGFYAFNITQATFLQFWTPSCLSMYGCGVPNGALWTICITLQFYILLYIFYPYIKKSTFKKDILILVVLIIINPCFSYLQYCIPEIMYKLVCQTIIPFMYMFYFGIIMSKYFNNYINYINKYFYIILLLYVGLYFVRGYLNEIPHVYLTQGPIPCFIDFIFWLSFAYKIKIKMPIDIQYGMYLNHMIVVNYFLHNNILIDNNVLRIIATIILSIILGFLSKTIASFCKKTTDRINI